MVRVASATALVAFLTAVGCGGRAHRAVGAHAGSASEPSGGQSETGGSGGAAAGESGELTGGGRGAGRGGSSGSSGAGTAQAGGTDGASGRGGGAGRSAAGFGGFGGEPSSAGESAGGAPGGDAGALGEAGGSGRSGEFPPRAACGTTYPPNAVKCDGLNQMTITAGPFLDAAGNEGISPGEDVKVVLTLHNTASQTFDAPCVGLLADDSAVRDLRGDSPGFNPWPKYFAILADQSLDFRATFHLDEGVSPGTVIHFVAWVTLQTAGCTNGNEIGLSLVVEP